MFIFKKIPDISKWNTNNLENISYLFNDCSSLNLLPDISKWNVKKVNNIEGIFKDCPNLLVIPDISKWEISNIKKDKINIFEDKPLFSSINISDYSKGDTISSSKTYSDEGDRSQTKNYSIEINPYDGSMSNELSNYYEEFYN